MKPYHWAALGVGLLGVVSWKLLSRPRGIPPGPVGLPLVGNLLQLSDAPHLDYMKFGKQYGEVFSLYFGGKLMIVLNSHRVIKEAFVTMGTTFADRPNSVVVGEGGISIFSEHFGEAFNDNKKFAVMALRFAGFGTKKAEDQMLLALDDLAEYLRKQDSKPVDDLLFPIQKAATNIIYVILFSKHISWEDPQLDRMIKDVEDFVSIFSSSLLLADAVPKWMVPLFFSKGIKQLQEKAEMIKCTYSLPYVQEHKECFDSSNIRDFVDYYLKGSELSEEEIAHLCLSFFPDAMITSAHQIGWNFLYLAQYPDMQSKIQKELEEVLGSQRPSVASRSNLHYTEAFLWETIRHVCIVTTSLMHKPLHDATLDGYHIPRSASVLANFWAVNMDPDIWTEPEKFRPERHLDENGRFVKKDNVIVFGQGRRTCLGEQLVKTEGFMFVASLLQRFTFQFSDEEPRADIKSLTDRYASDSFINRPPPCKVCAIPR